MSNTSAHACRETNCTCYSFVTTKTPVRLSQGFRF
nr:MAG TPA: Flavocytochrome c sulfide dehydrogenase [Caudoviricetes sp.]